jgi:putative ABC transport system permease protein
MRRLRAFIVRLASFLGFGRDDRDIADELLAHREMAAAEYQRSGLAPDDARRRAAAEFGSLAATADAYRDRRGILFLEHWIRDGAYAVRSLRRSPGLVVSMVLVLGLGIGLTTAIATVFHSVVWQGLAVPEPDRVVKLSLTFEGRISRHVSGAHSGFSYLELATYRDATRALSGVAGVDIEKVIWQSDTDLQSVRAALVTADYFRVLRVGPARGRVLAPNDARQPVAVISYRFWRETLGGREDVLGRPLVLDRGTYVVVGVTDAAFTGTDVGAIDVWLPLEAASTLRGNAGALSERNFSWLEIVGRLAPDVSAAAAAAEASVIATDFDRDNPGRRTTVHVERATRLEAGLSVSPDKTALVGAGAAAGVVIGLLLLICGSNVAALLLARGASRHKEIAVRVALGASRRRITQQLAAELLVIALAGAVTGVLVCTWAFQLVAIWLPIGGVLGTLAPDGRVFGLALVFSLGVAVVFGLAPARQAAGVDCLSALKGEGAEPIRLPAMRLRRLLISIQVAVSLILLVVAALLGRSLGRALSVDPGYPTHGLYFAELNRASASGTESTVGSPTSARQLRDAMGSQPGVVVTGLTAIAPFRGTGMSSASGGTTRDPVLVHYNSADEGYFRALGVTLLAGRFAGAQEPDAALVNASLARRFWGDARAAVDQLLEIPGPRRMGPRRVRVVGVIPAVQTTDIGVRDEPTYYLPIADNDTPRVVVVRAADQVSVPRVVLEAVRALDRGTLVTVHSLDEQLARATMPSRLGAAIAGLIGILALLVASVGIHGIVAHAVVARTREIGIRLALGAPRASVLRVVVRSSMVSVLTGVLAGGTLITVIGWSLSAKVRTLLFGLNPMDPTACAAATACLAGIVCAAAYLPARRALGLAPLDALRHET